MTEQEFKKKIETVEVGYSISIMDDLYLVQKIDSYNADGWRWKEYKLESLETGETHFFGWEEDDELEIYMTTKELEVDELGLNLSGFEPSFGKLDGVKKFEYDGDKFKLEESYNAVYNGKHNVQSFEFYCKKTDQSLSIDFWEESDGYKLESHLSDSIDPLRIEIIGDITTD